MTEQDKPRACETCRFNLRNWSEEHEPWRPEWLCVRFPVHVPNAPEHFCGEHKPKGPEA